MKVTLPSKPEIRAFLDDFGSEQDEVLVFPPLNYEDRRFIESLKSVQMIRVVEENGYLRLSLNVPGIKRITEIIEKKQSSMEEA